MTAALEVCIEAGRARCFASALQWPGWSRSGRDEEAAITRLLAYAPRYAPVARAAGERLPSSPRLEVVERLTGEAATDFGVPGVVASAESAPLDARGARRQRALLEACWQVFEAVVAGAPAALRKGPRGGGRDRDAIVAHVVEAERAYARRLGIALSPGELAAPAGVTRLRGEIADRLGARSDGRPAVERGWPPRYAARRIAWHLLDHAWEIEDRSAP